MREDLQAKLFAKYPQIFAQKDLDMQQTNMCWGIDCGDGWYTILDTLCGQIQNHLDWKNKQGRYSKYVGTIVESELVPQVEAEQVKEKFGGLRFYYVGGDDYVRGAVDLAEGLSLRTCEVCGSPGRQTKQGWIVTLCQTHAGEKNVQLSDEDKQTEE